MSNPDADADSDSGSDWEVDNQKREIRRTATGRTRTRHQNSVLIRLLNSGPNPCVGITVPTRVLATAGLAVGDRVYVLAETEGRLRVERVGIADVSADTTNNSDVDAGASEESVRYRDRSQLVPLLPADRADIKEALLELVRTREMDARQLESAKNRKLAKQKIRKADRLRWLARKIGG